MALEMQIGRLMMNVYCMLRLPSCLYLSCSLHAVQHPAIRRSFRLSPAEGSRRSKLLKEPHLLVQAFLNSGRNACCG